MTAFGASAHYKDLYRHFGITAEKVAELSWLYCVSAFGSVAVSNFPASQAVTGPLTDTQLRAAAVPVSVTSAATSANQATGNASPGALDTNLPADPAREGGNLATIAANGATAANQTTEITNLAAISAALGGTPSATVAAPYGSVPDLLNKLGKKLDAHTAALNTIAGRIMGLRVSAYKAWPSTMSAPV